MIRRPAISDRLFPPLIILLAALPYLAILLAGPLLYRVLPQSPYLLFHNLVELFSVIAAIGIFLTAWHAAAQDRNRRTLILSAAFLGVGLLDLCHLLSYPGMPPFITPNSPDKPTLFWLGARLFGALFFLASAFVPHPDRPCNRVGRVLLPLIALCSAAALCIAVVAFPHRMPVLLTPAGLTPVKLGAEYLIVALLSLGALGYARLLRQSGNRIYRYHLAALVFSVFSELAFTRYASAFDSYNLLGHLYKLAAFALFYRGIFITAIRQPYLELHQGRTLLATILDTIPQSIFWKDRQSIYQGCNQVFAQRAGLDNPALIVGRTDFDLPWSQAEAEGYRADDREVMEQDRPKRHIIESQRQADGTVLWMDTSKLPLHDETGTPQGVVGVYDDITDRKQVQEQLEESILFNRQFLDSINEGIIVYDRQLRYRLWNRFMEELTGVREEELLGRTPLEVFPFHSETGLMDRLAQALAGVVLTTVEFPYSLKNGTKTGWAVDSSSPLRNAEGEIIGVIGVVRETTSQRRIEEMLRQSQKMEALGQLAGGVAHDFNNILQVIQGYGSLIALETAPPVSDQAAEIVAAAQRGGALTASLLSYSRKHEFRTAIVDLREVVAGVAAFLRQILGKQITLTLEQPPEPLPALVDTAHIQQVLSNLAGNARDAMPGGGSFTIRLGRVEMTEPPPDLQGCGGPGPYLLLQVEDSGSGMAPDLRDHIFEPFFTTKEPGKGTGLGLAVVYGIITQHNGFITCASEPGKGTVFSIWLPAAG